MNLKHAAFLAALGLFISFAVKTLGTLAPELFITGRAALFGIVLQLLAGLTLVCFLIVFFRGLGEEVSPVLRRATLLAVLGSLVALVPDLQGLLRVMSVASVPAWVLSGTVQVVANWLAIASLTVFFIVLLKVAKASGEDWLYRGARAGFVGSVALLLMATLTAAGFLSGRFVHGPNILPLLMAMAVPLVLVGFLATMFFFVTVYQHPPGISDHLPASRV